jgi:hypothetical protein
MFCSDYVDRHEDKIHNEIGESDKKSGFGEANPWIGIQFFSQIKADG